MRVLIKGGVWKNTEDEILKAAVMKYGKNQWARISSLLTRKTPKQCKARWFEWLDPSIKKTEWSKEEDEKLLHLAKLMPTQWRTIGPVVGRTPAQCLERYQKLLDEAELGQDQGPSSEDVRKLRPGEIDPDPETKPARPDPVDMDEDEKEMLSEARARLANTQGKKAKRKAREKQLSEARRLANVQKRRELKGAGIALVIKDKYKYKGMDFNADIPFHREQPGGFWDINEERLREIAEKKDLTNELLSTLEGKRRMEIEEIERRKDFKKIKAQKESGELPIPQQFLPNKLKISDRKGLVLPAPQVTEADLESIVKMGVSGETARSMVTGAETPSTALLGEYSSVDAPTPMRTARIIAGTGEESIKTMARNLKALSSAQTPLLGDDINLEGPVEFATPLKTIPSTPNPLAQTPILLPGKTPLRDQIGINTPRVNSFEESTPRSFSARGGESLSSLFKQLPKPKNNFEIVLPEPEQGEDQQEDMVIDTEDYLAVQEQLKKQEEELKLKRRSTPVQMSLPRPVLDQEQLDEMYKTDNSIEGMIQREKTNLIHRDCKLYPLSNQPILSDFPALEPYDDYLLQAQHLISQELSTLELTPLSIPQLYLDFQHNVTEHKFTKTPDYKSEHQHLRDQMKTQAQKSQLSEKKLTIKLGGYINRNQALLQKYNDTYDTLVKKRSDLQVYENIKQLEEQFIENRIGGENKVVEELAGIEQDLQDRYRELQSLSLNR